MTGLAELLRTGGTGFRAPLPRILGFYLISFKMKKSKYLYNLSSKRKVKYENSFKAV